MMRAVRSSFAIRRATVADSDELSEIHAAAFSRGWSGAEFESLLLQPGTHALIAHYRRAFGRPGPAGFILYRLAADEAEVLTVAVAPGRRRRGIGRALLEEALRHAYREGARAHLPGGGGYEPRARSRFIDWRGISRNRAPEGLLSRGTGDARRRACHASATPLGRARESHFERRTAIAAWKPSAPRRACG